MYKYFPHTEADISEMLGKIGLSSLDELYAEIPENIRFDKDYDLKKSMSEDEVRNYFRELGKTNKKLIPFAGGGAYDRLSANSSPVRNTSRLILPISPKFLREHYNIYSSFKA